MSSCSGVARTPPTLWSARDPFSLRRMSRTVGHRLGIGWHGATIPVDNAYSYRLRILHPPREACDLGKKRIRTVSTSRLSARATPIVLRSGDNIRLLFRPEIVENVNDPDAAVSGK